MNKTLKVEMINNNLKTFFEANQNFNKIYKALARQKDLQDEDFPLRPM
jgi:hypothetical protein